MRRFWVILIFMLVGMLGAPAAAQGYYGYDFDTGSDSSLWENMDGATVLLDSSNVYEHIRVDLGFPFYFMGEYRSSFSVSSDGSLMSFDTVSPIGCAEAPFSVYSNPFEMGASIVPFYASMVMGLYGDTFAIRYKVLGGAGHHRLVVSFNMNCANLCTLSYQIHLSEEDGSVTILYRPCSIFVSGQVGMLNLRNEKIVVNSTLHSVSTSSTSVETWFPTEWRYYRFTPINCLPPGRLYSSRVSRNSAYLSWQSSPSAGHYVVEYGPANFTPGTGTFQYTTRTALHIDGLTPSTLYDVRVSTACDGSETVNSVPAITTFRTLCPNEDGRIDFTNLYDSSVVCRVGTFIAPDRSIQLVDAGPQSVFSRHTIHTQLGETDPQTNYQLSTIPTNRCRSVRLGNTQSGAEQESITYTLDIDTSNYNLLVLRYAIVEQNPSHPSSQQPYFSFSVTDSNDHLISPCYYANYVAGDLSDWNSVNSSLVWHDWQTVGVDLDPIHGQRVHVTISNADCYQGGHFGYGYFTLEGVNKHLFASQCGNTIENTFTAPEGFTYRWYSPSDDSVTLSSADTLHVTQEGDYCCWASYRNMGQSCGFQICSYAGPRYPVARFSSEPQNECGSLVHFRNHSRIARDEEHTQLTSEPCEQYLWIFDDGTTSTEDNPSHTFTEGTHTVTLVAQLAGGMCTDTATTTFDVHFSRDTLYDTVCAGGRYHFYGMLYSESGYYVQYDECFMHELYLTYLDPDTAHVFDTVCQTRGVWDWNVPNAPGDYFTTRLRHSDCDTFTYVDLHVYPMFEDFFADTIWMGDTISYFGQRYTVAGPHSYLLHTIHGCDSLQTLRLSCRARVDSNGCISDLPITWWGKVFNGSGDDSLFTTSLGGTDSIVHLHLDVHPDYVITRADTFCLGLPYHFHQNTYELPGVYTDHQSTVFGCDSLHVLELSCINKKDSAVCQDQFPYTWYGRLFPSPGADTQYLRSVAETDSIVYLTLKGRARAPVSYWIDTLCAIPSHYTVHLSDTLEYTWLSSPSEAVLCNRYDGADALLFPQTPTDYYLTAQYRDNPACPTLDTLHLLPVDTVVARIEVLPAWNDASAPLFIASDCSLGEHHRQWFVNSTPWDDASQAISYAPTSFEDSVCFALVASSSMCYDTVFSCQPVITQELFFPNVFTPDEPTNNRFRGYGVNITKYCLQVYTKWGDRIFETHDLEESWDGTYHGGKSPESAYVYRCVYTTLMGSKRTVVGTVLLLR